MNHNKIKHRAIHFTLTLILITVVILIGDHAGPTAEASPSDWSATSAANGRIVFVSARDGNAEIYTMNPDGSDPINLSNHDAAEYDPAWSADGTRIVFRSDRDGNPEIYVMNADGSDQTNLSENAAIDMQPAWSPDGTKIAFVREENDAQEIYVMDADGSDQTNLTQTASPISERNPDWSPDGSHIAYTQWNAGHLEVFVMDADGDNQTNLTDYAASSDEEPAWSPDGTQLAFASYRDGNNDIFVMDADGQNPVNLTQDDADDWYPAWSPDGEQLVFASARTGTTAVVTMNADGSDQTTLTGAGLNFQPHWGSVVNDSDGIPPDVEDGAPNGGDGNGDGTPDSQQSNVSSLPNSEDGEYLTLAAPNSTQLMAVKAIDNPSPSDAPPGATFPLGFLSFRVEGLDPGAAVTVDIFSHSDADVDVVYKYGPTAGNQTPHWYEFMKDGATGAEQLADRWRFYFVDGGRGDSDLTANGIIVDPQTIGRRPVVVCSKLTGVTISGPTAVDTNKPLILDAQILPANATIPVTYLWTPEPTAGQNTPKATYQWSAVGQHMVTVTVTNCQGTGQASDDHPVTISTATPVVRVNDEGGASVSGAAVYRNGAPVGHTDAAGLLPLADLAVGDKLVATQQVFQQNTDAAGHDGWAYRVYISPAWPSLATASPPHKRSATRQTRRWSSEKAMSSSASIWSSQWLGTPTQSTLSPCVRASSPPRAHSTTPRTGRWSSSR